MDLLGLRTLPFLARRNCYYELKHLLFWSVLAGVVEGQFASVVVSKSFEGGDLLIAIAAATPMGAMLFSLMWGMLCVGRPKIRLAMMFASGTALCAGMVGAIPTSPVGAIWFVGQMAAAQVLMAGVVTVRSAFWKSNYPRSARGRITARLQGLRFVVRVGTVLCAAAICDRDATSYRFIFPVAALCGAIGIYLLPRIHIRGERSELTRRREPAADHDLRRGMVEPFSLTALLSPGHVLGQMVRVLGEDRRFARYCLAQFMMGVANFMTTPVLVVVITRELDHGATWGFWISTGVIVALPPLVMLGTIGRWGRFLDRFGVVQLRVLNVTCWTASFVLGTAATFVAVHAGYFAGMHVFLAIALFAGRSILTGLGQGGGTLAWTIGHLHFAQRAQAEIYMGIHVSLTGIRGLLSPFVGMWLWGLIGWPVWLVAVACSLTSLVMYVLLARDEQRTGRPRGADE